MDLRGHRASRWSVTCNLKNVARSTVDAHIDNAKSLGWGIEGQLERGSEGTDHYQLLVKTPQIRFSAIKRVFPTAHIEPARNAVALQAYVHKSETRLETLKSVEISYVTWKQVRDKFFEWLVNRFDVGVSAIIEDEERLARWDEFIGLSIEEGIEVDTMGVNPQYRSCILRYWSSYIRRQLDRQTDNISVDTSQSDKTEVSPPIVTQPNADPPPPSAKTRRRIHAYVPKE